MPRAVALPIAALLCVSLFAVSPAGAQGERQGAPKTSFGSKLTAAQVTAKLQTLIDQPAPAGLSPAELSSYQAHTEWLRQVVTRLEVIYPRDAATGQASGRRQYEPITIRKEHDALMLTIEEENQKFSSVSNVLKTRHETAMSSIRNLK